LYEIFREYIDCGSTFKLVLHSLSYYFAIHSLQSIASPIFSIALIRVTSNDSYFSQADVHASNYFELPTRLIHANGCLLASSHAVAYIQSIKVIILFFSCSQPEKPI
jgi:hypothetical protein